MTTQPKQLPADNARILRNLPDGVQRVQVLTSTGKTAYKSPNEVDTLHDQIMMNSEGEPIVMRGRPGRRAKVELVPVSEGVKEVQEARNHHIEDSPLVRAARSNPMGNDVLDHTLAAMAEEAAALEFERKEAERHGRDSSGISGRRARVLKALADFQLKRQGGLAGSIDLESKPFQVLFDFILDTVRKSMVDAGVQEEHVETVFIKLAKRLDDNWISDAKTALKDRS